MGDTMQAMMYEVKKVEIKEKKKKKMWQNNLYE